MSETQEAAPATQVPLIEKRIAQFIQLRDRIKAEDDAHNAKMKPMKDLLAQLNAAILDHLNTTGGDSIAVRGVGTAYKTVKASASIADGDEFRRFVIGGELWDMVDWKANVAAVQEYNEKNEHLPPGVTLRRIAVVGVRRDS